MEVEPVVGLEILTKANAVVIALESAGEMTAQQIAQAVREPLSSTYRLLQSLVSIGWVEPGRRRGMFRLGVYFMQVGGQFEDRIDVRRVAFEPLRDLRIATGWTSFLCVRRGARAVCVERFDGAQVRSMALQVGDSLPLSVGAAPLAILAFLPSGERRPLIEQLAVETAEAGFAPTTVAELQSVVEDVRRRGIARSDSDVTLGIAALAAPVFNHRRELVASLSVSGLRSAVLDHEQELTSRVLRAASDVSARLGHEGARR